MKGIHPHNHVSLKNINGVEMLKRMRNLFKKINDSEIGYIKKTQEPEKKGDLLYVALFIITITAVSTTECRIRWYPIDTLVLLYIYSSDSVFVFKFLLFFYVATRKLCKRFKEI